MAGRIKRNKCAAVGGGSGKCNERGMGRETDLHRERESDGGRGGRNDAEQVVTGKGRLKKVSRSKQVTRTFASGYGNLSEMYTRICAGFSRNNAVKKIRCEGNAEVS